MKRSKFLPLFRAAAMGLAVGVFSAEAREASKTMSDLMSLEAKVESVSAKNQPATVALVSEKLGSSGSGVITSEDGLILTAAHVIQGATEVTVVFSNGRETRGKVLGANYSKDIAMVQILEKGPWPFLKMGASKPIKAGDWVVALGHSTGFDAARTPPVRFGHVVSKGPGNFFTTDCTLIGGDSGGPLFDLNGDIVGIHSSIGYSYENNNHAGIDGFRQDWERLKSGEAWGELQMNPNANPEMPVLGIVMGPLTRFGVLVENVTPRSPAAAAGVRVGDAVQAINGDKIRGGQELMQVLAKYQAGDLVKLSIRRDEQTLEMDVTLARRDSIYQTR
ncbi:MAG: trypsin-like peptidase domain-containing protein [Luteolibacter sp.]